MNEMTGKIIFQTFITREEVRKNKETTIYVFGDNMMRYGKGGQAKYMRGEPNSIGIPTKWAPRKTPVSFFKDSNFEDIKYKIDSAFAEIRTHLLNGKNIVFPKNGIGTGRAELPHRAPKIFSYINQQISDLSNLANPEKQDE